MSWMAMSPTLLDANLFQVERGFLVVVEMPQKAGFLRSQANDQRHCKQCYQQNDKQDSHKHLRSRLFLERLSEK